MLGYQCVSTFEFFRRKLHPGSTCLIKGQLQDPRVQNESVQACRGREWGPRGGDPLCTTSCPCDLSELLAFSLAGDQGSHLGASLLLGATEPHLGTPVIFTTGGSPGIKQVGPREAAQHPQCPGWLPRE